MAEIFVLQVKVTEVWVLEDMEKEEMTGAGPVVGVVAQDVPFQVVPETQVAVMEVVASSTALW